MIPAANYFVKRPQARKGMRVKRKAALIIGALSLGVAGFAGFGPAAQAADKPPAQSVEEALVEVVDTSDVSAQAACSNNRLCLYEHDNFAGRYYLQIELRAGICGNLPAEYNNWASSQKNTNGRSVWFYDRANCSGTHGYSARAESQDKDLTNNGFDNKTSSLLL
ncbi:peptidase inhibitor family I36 protein [Nonomuraea sp. NPDC059023]|uniref:peptidase inhibitor family I36 protein n=1 Tax=unclassified Nonomuraea TaxID=2593643 RepID=UPI00368227D5